jgi:asparagine synthase (glutamine-hydrolysing)
MCGIAGRFFHSPNIPTEVDLYSMGAAMQYRGPDDCGYFRAPSIGLVHRRLSIRDLSPAGRCPMANQDGRIQVLLNGEIYNWRELRTALEGAGHLFSTQSDTEVIVRGYEAWGDGLIPKLRGMFALAIWDAKRQRLLLVRDRVGEKPLFYRCDNESLVFASSIEAIAAVLPDLEIDSEAIACHLAYGFVPHTHTVWQNIKVLPPAHLLFIDPGQEPVLQPYWAFPRAGPSRMGLKACMKTMEAVIEDSVVRCVDADVPVGVFLSGGVDSSLIAAMAARHRPGLPAFSLGFREKDFSELPYARQVAAHLGLTHHVIEVGVEELLACLPHLVKQYGQPFGDASAVPSFLVSKLAREHVKVCLSGDGGDESFGGYWRMQSGVYAARYGSCVPRRLRAHWVPGLARKLGQVGQKTSSHESVVLGRAWHGVYQQ